MRIAKATRDVECLGVPDRVMPLEGLSRMMGNYHVRFLGEKGAATPLTYPAGLPGRGGYHFKTRGVPILESKLSNLLCDASAAAPL
jgi:hypothetical protein